jgi:hypothetical protein
MALWLPTLPRSACLTSARGERNTVPGSAASLSGTERCVRVCFARSRTRWALPRSLFRCDASETRRARHRPTRAVCAFCSRGSGLPEAVPARCNQPTRLSIKRFRCVIHSQRVFEVGLQGVRDLPAPGWRGRARLASLDGRPVPSRPVCRSTSQLPLSTTVEVRRVD